jgi:hypothetical protein
MASTETDVARWTRRAKDAAIEAVCFGADPDTVRAAVEAGIREGARINALRNGTHVPADRPAPRAVPEQGSAIAALLKATA